MLLEHFRGQPTDHVLEYVGGKVAREGKALSFYYLPLRTSVVVVPTQSIDASFVFQEMTQAYQIVAIQGQFTYRIVTPRHTAELLNFAVNPKTRQYLSEDPERLRQRITNVVHMEMRREVAGMLLEEVLKRSGEIADAVSSRIRDGRLVESLGVELLSLHVLNTKPAPEMAKALEAESREALLRRADEAIYARRRAAVDEERQIKESELATDTTLEQQREELIALQGANVEREAEYKARATGLELSAYSSTDPRTLLAVALKDLGENASQIGTLTVTTEMLASILNGSNSGAA
ncbi:MAG TPA: SPFH domain-containing protein [Chloroflexota bacterium]